VRLAILLVLAACADKSDPRWQLDHDRVVAVRATPSHIPAGAVTTLDALVAHADGPTDMEAPTVAQVSPTAPAVLAGTLVSFDAGAWHVTAPSEATLDAARAALMLDAGAPVPLDIGMTFGSAPLVALKTIYLGDSADNPTIADPMVNDVAVTPADSLVIPTDTDVPLSVTADDMAMVNWLTSCGTMHDDNEHAAFVHVLPADPMMGELAVVVRDPDGGVAWQVWPIQAQ
jgi:hypothetical protein